MRNYQSEGNKITKINLLEDILKELNTKVYTITVKKTQGRTHSKMKFKIYNTIILYSKEKWIFMIGTRLQKVEPIHNKRQDAITINWRSM